MDKRDKFYEVKNFLQCPICGKKIRFHAGGLVCKREHRFDISSKGYVNFLQASKQLNGYERQFFESRRRIFDAGYYNHIVEAVSYYVMESIKSRNSETVETSGGGDPLMILDAGCGEGFYALALQKCLRETGNAAQVMAFDIAADAIRTAAKSGEPVKWMVADITNIPVRDGAADMILDVFTPANYKEFIRIMKPDGRLIKVVPGAAHMEQLRRAAAPLLRNKSYSNEDVLDYFEKNFEIIDKEKVSRTIPVRPAHLADLVQMTPLLFDVDKSRLDVSDVGEITVEAEVLVGKAR